MQHARAIDLLGGYTALAESLDMPVGRVRFWHRRDNIPAEYWPEVVKVAKSMRKGRAVTIQGLALAKAGERRA